jgi:hypothetical protein
VGTCSYLSKHDYQNGIRIGDGWKQPSQNFNPQSWNVLNHDNTPAHTAILAGQFLKQKQILLMEHPSVLLFGSVWLLSIPNYKSYKYFTERDAFWVFGGCLAEYVTSTKSIIRRCVPEMLPTVRETISFVYSCQSELSSVLTYKVIPATF